MVERGHGEDGDCVPRLTIQKSKCRGQDFLTIGFPPWWNSKNNDFAQNARNSRRDLNCNPPPQEEMDEEKA